MIYVAHWTRLLSGIEGEVNHSSVSNIPPSTKYNCTNLLPIHNNVKGVIHSGTDARKESEVTLKSMIKMQRISDYGAPD